MASTVLTTYRDLLDHCLDYYGSDAGQEALRFARRAVQSAYQTLCQLRRWSYYYQRGRLVSVAPYNTGTVAYTQTGGTYERQMVLTGGSWPSWAAFGVVRIGQVIYEVDQLIDSATITLTSNSNPGADLPAGTSYQIVRDSFPMPVDFLASDEFINVGNQAILVYQQPREWLAYQRIVATPATPRIYTFTSDPNYLGAMAVRFYPPPDNVYTFDYIYNRRPRNLLLEEYASGTLSTTANSATVTGVGTTWTGRMVGSVINFSADSATKPTGPGGANPFFAQRVVTAVASPTSLTVDALMADTLVGVKYAISDPVDIEDGAMYTFLLREVEKQARIARRMKPAAAEEEHYQQAAYAAMEADVRTFSPRSAGDQQIVRRRLAFMPSGPDIP